MSLASAPLRRVLEIFFKMSETNGLTSILSRPSLLRTDSTLALKRLAAQATVANSSNAERIENAQIAPGAGVSQGGALREIQELLTELEGLVTSRLGFPPSSARHEAQSRIDEIIESIDEVSQKAELSRLAFFDGGDSFTIRDVATDVRDVRLLHTDLQPGESLDVEVEVTKPATFGELTLEIGGNQLDLGAPNRQFRIEIGGVAGSRELSFASGTQLNELEAAFNTFSDVTGVRAEVEGTAVKLFGVAPGSDQFVSLRILDDGGIENGAGARGVSKPGASTSQPEASALHSLSLLKTGTSVTDFGNDIEGHINGKLAKGRGARLALTSADLTVDVLLQTDLLARGASSPTNETFAAFTIEANKAPGKAPAIDASSRLGRRVNYPEDNAISLADLRSPDFYFLSTGQAIHVVQQAQNEIKALFGQLGRAASLDLKA